MEVSLIILAALVAVGTMLYLHDRHSRRRAAQRGLPPEPPYQEPTEECCGLHATCERDSLIATVSPDIVYFDDEELDIFRGRTPESYTDDEIEQFRDIFLTLLPDDIAPWARSIRLRNIELPPPVKEELLMVIAEARQNTEIHGNT